MADMSKGAGLQIVLQKAAEGIAEHHQPHQCRDRHPADDC